MQNHRKTGFTLIELLVMLGIAPLLVSLVLPAMTTGRDSAKISQSKSNIRNVSTAHGLYSNDHNNMIWTGTPHNTSIGSWTGVPIHTAINNWAQQSGSKGGTGDTIFPSVQPCEIDGSGHRFTFDVDHIAPYCYGEGLTTSPRGFARVGTFRFTNTRQIAEYMEGDCYDKAFWAPKDQVITSALQDCWDNGGTSCATTYMKLPDATIDVPFLLQPSSYGLSPPNMVSPRCYRIPRKNEKPADAFTDPMEFASGFKAATLSQSRYPSLKTFLMEMHLLQTNSNITNANSKGCGPNWADSAYPYHVSSGSNDSTTWSYDGCYPSYFNASWRSQPVTVFMDGHVRMITMETVEMNDYTVARGNGTGGHLPSYNGLWHRGVAGDLENGFFVECRTDWGNCSIHTHTAGGLTLGRDILPGS